MLSQDGDAKVAEQDLVVASEQQILRLDVTMYQLCGMRILQSVGHLRFASDAKVDRRRTVFPSFRERRPVSAARIASLSVQ